MIGTGYKSATAQLIGDGVVIEHFAIVPFALWIERRGKSKHLDGLQKSDDTLSIELDTCTGLVHVDGTVILPYLALWGVRGLVAITQCQIKREFLKPFRLFISNIL